MTKKHFIELANGIRRNNERREAAGLPPMFDASAISALADWCQSHNPRFNRARWLDYIAGKCGSNGGAIKSHPRTGLPQHDENDQLHKS